MEKRRIVLHNSQSPGDVLMITAAVRDLVEAHGDDIEVDVKTPAISLWDNNPHITKFPHDGEVEHIKAKYPLIHKSNQLPYHFIHGPRMYLEEKLGLDIPQGPFRGDIHLSEEEKSWIPQIQEETGEDKPYWIVVSGIKSDFTAKGWSTARYQKVVDGMNDMGITCVQAGAANGKQGGLVHRHPALKGVVNLVGKTTIREFVRLVYHSSGVICPVTFAMHLAAAVEPRKNRCLTRRPCVVVAGGREPSSWEAYPHHAFLHTQGKLKCCADGGCWKSKSRGGGKSVCVDLVKTESGPMQRCMSMITPEDVLRHVREYREGLESAIAGR